MAPPRAALASVERLDRLVLVGAVEQQTPSPSTTLRRPWWPSRARWLHGGVSAPSIRPTDDAFCGAVGGMAKGLPFRARTSWLAVNSAVTGGYAATNGQNFRGDSGLRPTRQRRSTLIRWTSILISIHGVLLHPAFGSSSAPRTKKPTGPSGAFMIILGAVFFVAGLYVHRSYSPYPDGLTATGTITEIESGPNRKGTLMYTAVYTFTTADGRQVSFRDPASSSSKPDRGAAVDVSYQAAEPELARRVPGFDRFGWLIILMGALLAAFGALSMVRAVQRLTGR